MELYDHDGTLIGDFPPQIGICRTFGCENFGEPIEVPNHPSVTLLCGVCGEWVIHPSLEEDSQNGSEF